MRMSWVEIHDEILGPKLRGLRKKLNCSEAKAVGILAILWLWAGKNVDEDGMLANTDEADISNALRQYVGDDSPDEITAALIESGWIDKVDGTLMIHDWYEWQADAVYLQAKRSKDRIRKRQERSAAKAQKAVDKEPKQEADQEVPVQKPKPPKKQKEQKIKFAEYVTLTQAEHDKLVAEYGDLFVQKMIETLDNYKGASGKKYASDYRAMLNWVVERVEQRYPKLKGYQTTDSSIDMDEVERLMNPQAPRYAKTGERIDNASFDLAVFKELKNRF